MSCFTVIYLLIQEALLHTRDVFLLPDLLAAERKTDDFILHYLYSIMQSLSLAVSRPWLRLSSLTHSRDGRLSTEREVGHQLAGCLVLERGHALRFRIRAECHARHRLPVQRRHARRRPSRHVAHSQIAGSDQPNWPSLPWRRRPIRRGEPTRQSEAGTLAPGVLIGRLAAMFVRLPRMIGSSYGVAG